MKKLVVVLFIFYVNTLSAQSFNIGITAGGIDYHFRQQPSFLGLSYYSFGLCGQYTFKDSGVASVEANADFCPSGLNNTTLLWVPYKGFSSAEFICFNPFPKSMGLILQFKVGAFYASYDASSGLTHPDYGPVIGMYLGIFRLSKKSYLGLDADYRWGLQSYSITGYEQGTNFTLNGNSNINYATFSIKLIHKL